MFELTSDQARQGFFSFCRAGSSGYKLPAEEETYVIEVSRKLSLQTAVNEIWAFVRSPAGESARFIGKYFSGACVYPTI